MKKTTLASLVGLLFAVPAYAHDSIYSDDVVVTASRIPQSREAVLADVSVITAEEIEHAGQSTLVELLQSQPGIEISSNGGTGKTSGIYMRGANTDQLVVLLDGIRIGSPTLGTTAFENIPLAQVERIEIIRGPASSLYGSDAIGGVIQIFTKKGDDHPRLSAFIGYGTYNTRKGEASVSGSYGATHYALSASIQDTDGFSAKRSKTGVDADNDPYNNKAVSAHLSQQIAEGHEIGIQLYESAGRNYYDDGQNSYANFIQREISITSQNRFVPNWLSTLRIGEGVDSSDDHGAFGTVNTRGYQKQLTWQNDISVPLGILTLAYDRLEQRIESDTSYAETKRDNNGFIASYSGKLGNHSLQASLRQDDNSQFGNHTTGGLGYGYQINTSWRTAINFGTAFRAPTLNQLYFPFGFGNPNLRPETSRNIEAGVYFDQGVTHTSLVAYRNKVKDLIDIDRVLFTSININQALLEGITASYATRITDFNIRATVDLQNPENETNHQLLARRAHQHGNLQISHTFNALEIGTEIVASSKRNEYEFFSGAVTKLDGYALVNIYADYKINNDWSINARANNVFDKDYELASGYNTPGANLFVGLRWQPK